MTFTSRLITALFDAQWPCYRDNHDHHRFGPKPKESIANHIKHAMDSMASMFGFRCRAALNRLALDDLEQWAPLFPDLDWLYSRFADDVSRDLLVRLIAYRLMGNKAVRLPLNKSAHWNRIRQLDILTDPSDSIPIGFKDWKLPRHDLSSLGYPVVLYALSAGVMSQFLLGQYCCERAGVTIGPGAVVIDGGGCYGDTALFFAAKTGGQGRVLSFECVPENVNVFQKNLAMNPALARCIEIVPHAMWSVSGTALYVSGSGPGSRVDTTPSTAKQEQTTTTLTIDDLVQERNLDKVDLIKMDIEGAEYEALKGARLTLQRYRPTLALCLYHAPVDFVRLARFIEEQELRYNYYLDHYSIHAEETVLYAVPIK